MTTVLSGTWVASGYHGVYKGDREISQQALEAEGLGFLFLGEKKENFLAVPGPPRVAQGLRESLAKIIQINVYHGAGQRETMKPFHVLLPRLGGLPWLPSFLLIRDSFSALLFMIKNILEVSVLHSKEFFHLVLIYLSTSYSAGWGPRLSLASCHRTGPGQVSRPSPSLILLSESIRTALGCKELKSGCGDFRK